MAPHAPVNRGATNAHVDLNASTDEDEDTPIMAAGHDRGRNYQTTPLHTHAEASAESTPHLSPMKQRRDGGDSGAAAVAPPPTTTAAQTTPSKATGLSPKPPSESDSVRRERRKLRHSAPMRAASPDGDEGDEADAADAYAGRRGGRVGQWWRLVVDKYGSVELDNKGSVARDHLALERTFLAWLRTSLSFASIGIAITQLFRLNTTITDREGLQPVAPGHDIVRLRQMGKPLGATFLGIAILVLLVGSRRYFESQFWIIRGKFPASRGSVVLVTFVAVSLIVASLAIVLVVSPTQFEN